MISVFQYEFVSSFQMGILIDIGDQHTCISCIVYASFSEKEPIAQHLLKKLILEFFSFKKLLQKFW